MAEAISRRYDMGYRAQEFADVLCGPFSGNESPFRVESRGSQTWHVTHVDSPFDMQITLETKPDRKLGLMSLPVLSVDFDCSLDENGAGELFFHRFHQYFHKGGG